MADDPTADRTRKLTELRRLDSAAKTRRVLAALDATISAGQPLTIAALARHARVSRRFICDHPELAPWRSARTPVLLEGSASGHRPPAQPGVHAGVARATPDPGVPTRTDEKRP